MIFIQEIYEISVKLWERISQPSRSGASQCGQSALIPPAPYPFLGEALTLLSLSHNLGEGQQGEGMHPAAPSGFLKSLNFNLTVSRHSCQGDLRLLKD